MKVRLAIIVLAILQIITLLITVSTSKYVILHRSTEILFLIFAFTMLVPVNRLRAEELRRKRDRNQQHQK